ncbi:PREDICTED: uncharacterized protein LOC105558510 isoform X2 [Vollenhovia emeryi]|uniref:uncharacterized protein LOC105558510 isoform X2 n=1 Tax=Vollenhovia emeryi TaxID=411798 RepID=UPI0005F3A794|nr:PREDICTED: uncharacterized protein LOC105558510 isoform X2 [Vollenhovia emeryi]
MVNSCIVSGCNSNSNGYSGERINFFLLPKNQIIREAWLRKIGENSISKNTAKVCSLHFSEDSFVVPKKKSKVPDCKKRLRLLQTAIPTLFLTSTEKRADNPVNLDLNIIRQEFPLVCNPGTSRVIADEREKTNSGTDALNELCDTNENLDGPNETDGITATPKRHSRSNPWLNKRYRVIGSPPSALHTLENECNFTFPRRSLKFQPHAYNVRASALRKRKQRGKAHSKRSAEVTPEGAIICSDENTPLSTRRQRFFMDNCDKSVITSASKPTEMDKLRAEVTLLKAEVHHYRSLHAFHMQSNCTDLAMQTPVEAENEALKQLLQEKEEQVKKISAEKEEMLKLINDLQAQLASIYTAIGKAPQEREEYVRTLLKPYFTEGQIQCILTQKKWIQWSIDDYASAISLRNSLRRWAAWKKGRRRGSVKGSGTLPSKAPLLPERE